MCGNSMKDLLIDMKVQNFSPVSIHPYAIILTLQVPSLGQLKP